MTSAPRQAAFFDLDKTIIAKSSTLAFGKQFFAGGLINRRAVLKATYAQLVYMASGADEDQIEKIRRHLTEMVAGWDVDQVRSIVAETLHEVVDPIVYHEATELIAEHRAEGRDIVIVSASGAEVVEPIGAMLGVDHVIATTIETVDGRYTGEIEFYAYGEHKSAAMRRLAEQHGYDLALSHAYSDSATDLPMLEAVGHPTVVNPDRELKAIAMARDWPVLHFSHGVSLQERLDRLAKPSTPVIASTAAVGTAAAIAAVAWFGTKRRREGASARTV
ncbi:HAD family hydrolase [Cumulibacter manganitolerans]|uniref:HAD family hydrolase n=1 Tax=Cumulibacter manganitolerans TaxID=1884992 RepID=UPI0012968E9D|nr:HAD family hydrolase [Cumulibacter manganitolerans]